MHDKKQARTRRGLKTRRKLAELNAVRLTVHRSNCHIYAQVIDPAGAKVLASASTLEKDVRAAQPKSGSVGAATAVAAPTLPLFGCAARTSFSSVDADASTLVPAASMTCA